MNHDYCHCFDYNPGCPESCFRAQLMADIEANRERFVGVPMTYAHLGGTPECPLTVDPPGFLKNAAAEEGI